MYQSFGNRALAYLKTKCNSYTIILEFKKALDDCESALRLNCQYTKAYHRKAKALIGLSTLETIVENKV
jgi:hypothetical protein